MSSMSYCQFRNTENDLRQCLDAITDADSIGDFSTPEQEAAERMVQLAEMYVSYYYQLLEESHGEDDE